MNINPYEILGYGVIGLGFLLALFSYRLLSIEQKKISPRKIMLNAINIFMAFAIIMCVVGVFGEFVRNNSDLIGYHESSKNGISVQLISARPGNTNIGNSNSSIREIENLLTNNVSNNLFELCFSDKIEQELYGKVNFLVYQGSNGFANNVTIKETNIDNSYFSCIKDVFRGTKFPEPIDLPDTLINRETGKEYSEAPSYWVTAIIKVKK